MAFSAPAITAYAAVLATSASVYSSEAAKASATKGRRMQKNAQEQAAAAALKQERQGQEQIKRASQEKPDVLALLAESEERKLRPPSTLLSGMPSSTLLGQ